MKKLLSVSLAFLMTSGILLAQVNFVSIGNSITHGKYSSGITHSTTLGDSLKEMSYRFWLWEKLDSAGINATMVGSNTTYFGQFANPVVTKSRYSVNTFVNNHEAYYGINTDGFIAGGFSQDGVSHPNFDTRLLGFTPDVALINIGHNDDTSKIAITEANYKSIITKLRSRNPNIIILLSGMTSNWKTQINSRIPRIAAEMTTVNSIVYPVDMTTGYISDPGNPSITMTLDWVHPNAKGQKFMALRWYNAYMKVAKTDTVKPTVPANPAIINITASTVDLSWTASTDGVGINVYQIYRDGVLLATTGLTKYTLSGSAINVKHAYTISAVDYQKNESPKSISVIYPCKITINLSDNQKTTLANTPLYVNSVKKSTSGMGSVVYSNLLSGQYIINVPVSGYFPYADTFLLNTDTVLNIVLTKKDVPINISQAEEQFSVFPNPAGGYLYISNVANLQVELVNEAGIIAFSIKSPETDLAINLDNIPDGFYTVVVSNKDSVRKKKIIIHK